MHEGVLHTSKTCQAVHLPPLKATRKFKTDCALHQLSAQMASKTLTFSVRPRGKPLHKLPEELPLPSTSASSDLYNQLATSSKTSVHRLRITKGSDGTHIPNTASLPISDTGLRDGSTIYVKDLGPQISWRLVYFLEYIGPLLIHPLLYAILPASPPSTLQSLSCAFITLHFLKREIETLFVHRFSAATMPLFNLVLLHPPQGRVIRGSRGQRCCYSLSGSWGIEFLLDCSRKILR